MATSPESITPNQLKLARVALWHQNGSALRTMDDAREWLDAAGLVPYYPHPQFAAAPQPSFAEAVLGRPENGWVPQAAAVEDEEPEEGEESDDEEFDEDFDDDESEEDEESEDEDEESDDDEEEETEDEDPAASDDEIMLTTDDEAAEDEGDEIAEQDRIHAGGDPTPNDVAAAEEAVEPEPEVEPINGFTAEEKETVSRTLARLIAEGSAVPLSLLGTSTGEPDFICSASAFSFVFTLRGDKNFKNEPAQTGSLRVSPLAVKVHELLKEKGGMTANELSREAGQGVVDSAILRSLCELWAIQRVIPVPDAEGAPAKWELLTGRFVRHLKAGANAGQPTALSALLSLYLSKAMAASSDEMETFLSPLAARSRVREVVSGLQATRQLDSVVVEGKTLLYLPGALDNLPEESAVASVATMQPRSRYEDDDRRHMIEERAARFAEQGGEPERRGNFPVRRPAAAGDRPARTGGFVPRQGGSSGPRREGGFAPRREGGFAPQRRSTGFGGPRREGGFAPREGGFAGGRDDRERRPFQRRDDAAAPAARTGNEFARPWDDEQRPAQPSGEGRPAAGGFSSRDTGERRPFTPREGGERRPFTPRGDRPSFGDRKPFTPREGGARSFAPRGDRPFTPRGDRPFTPREGGERRPFTPREGSRPSFGDRKPFTPREGGDRRPFTPRGDRPFGDRPFTPRGDRPFTPREGGERRPFTPRAGGDRPFTPRGDRPFTPREGGRPSFGDRKPFTPREGGDRPFTPRGDRPFTPRAGGDRPFTPRGDRPFTPREGGRPSFGDRKPFTPREGGDRKSFAPRGDRPFTPRGDRPFTPREGGGDRRPFTPREGGERRPFTPREGGRPSFGDRKPFAPRGDRPFTPREGGERRPFTPREGGSRPSFGDRKPFAPRSGGGGRSFAPRDGAPRGGGRGPGSGPSRPFTPRRSE